MTISRDQVLLTAVLIFWAVTTWLVADYNFGFGSTTMRWPNPAHPAAAWHWDVAETTPTVIEPQTGQWLRVTLPRGFISGTLEVRTVSSTDLVLRAEQRDSQPDLAQVGDDAIHSLSFRWSELVARGRTFRFRVANPTDDAMTVASMKLILKR